MPSFCSCFRRCVDCFRYCCLNRTRQHSVCRFVRHSFYIYLSLSLSLSPTSLFPSLLLRYSPLSPSPPPSLSFLSLLLPSPSFSLSLSFSIYSLSPIVSPSLFSRILALVSLCLFLTMPVSLSPYIPSLSPPVGIVSAYKLRKWAVTFK